jgi:murein DD-endopeptidase MepM/ murein hydrolase activator NlpD
MLWRVIPQEAVMWRTTFALIGCLLLWHSALIAQLPEPTRKPVRAVVDLDVGESAEVALSGGGGGTARVELIATDVVRDPIRNAVRKATVKVRIDGQEAELVSGTYRLPVLVGGVQVDCPITQHYYQDTRNDAWALKKQARLRLWPGDAPWIERDAFMYPVKQRWFSDGTQMGNVPTFVDGGERPASKPTDVYYHSGLDIGGAEAMVDVVAATDGIVVSSGMQVMEGVEAPISRRYDVVYLRDDRGWFYRYSHLHTIDPAMKVGAKVKMGQRVGLLGKEGGSGGWSHLHFEITAPQPSGEYGTEDGYAYIWQAYLQQYKPTVIAVARPHSFVRRGDAATLDGSRSRAAGGPIARYEWQLHDGSTATGATVERRYADVGTYSEILKVTDVAGNIGYDFHPVHVVDPATPGTTAKLPPSVQLVYYPTFDIKPGDEVTFKVRTFRTKQPRETIDFGDGTPAVTVRSDGNAKTLDPNGFAVTTHRFAKPGVYLVTARTINEHGYPGTCHVAVHVGQ